MAVSLTASLLQGEVPMFAVLAALLRRVHTWCMPVICPVRFGGVGPETPGKIVRRAREMTVKSVLRLTRSVSRVMAETRRGPA